MAVVPIRFSPLPPSAQCSLTIEATPAVTELTGKLAMHYEMIACAWVRRGVLVVSHTSCSCPNAP